MSSFDSEINSLRLRLAALEEKKQKEIEKASVKKAFPLKTLEDIINDKKNKIQANSYSKGVPLARFYDQEKVEYLEPIYIMLKNIQLRLEELENNGIN